MTGTVLVYVRVVEPAVVAKLAVGKQAFVE